MIDAVNSPYIHEGTTANFQAMVLDNSQKGPVLVNFWSIKAGPCLCQYPILDKLIHHYTGRVLLINVDTEQEVRITKVYGITSVPVLKLFRHAQPVETLHGFQAEEEVIKLLDRYVVRDSDLALAEAIKLYSAGQCGEAYGMITQAIVEDPDNPRLSLTVGKLLKHEERYAETLKLINALPEDIWQNPEITRFHDVLSFCAEVDPQCDIQTLLSSAAAMPVAIETKQQLVAHFFMQKKYDLALQQLATIMELDADYHRYAKKAMLQVFNIIGQEHLLATQYRAHLKRYTH